MSQREFGSYNESAVNKTGIFSLTYLKYSRNNFVGGDAYITIHIDRPGLQCARLCSDIGQKSGDFFVDGSYYKACSKLNCS